MVEDRLAARALVDGMARNSSSSAFMHRKHLARWRDLFARRALVDLVRGERQGDVVVGADRFVQCESLITSQRTLRCELGKYADVFAGEFLS